MRQANGNECLTYFELLFEFPNFRILFFGLPNFLIIMQQGTQVAREL
jgi:hypothetical protein